MHIKIVCWDFIKICTCTNQTCKTLCNVCINFKTENQCKYGKVFTTKRRLCKFFTKMKPITEHYTENLATRYPFQIGSKLF